jgi:CBS domain-containing protein
LSLNTELAEISDFIAACPPFDRLTADGLEMLTRAVVIRYLRRGADFPPAGDACLWLLRQGAIELRTPDGVLARRLAEGDIHDAPCLPDSPERQWLGHAAEDSLLYALPEAALRELWAAFPALKAEALHSLGERLRQAKGAAAVAQRPERDLTSLPLSRLIGRAPVVAEPGISIRAAAALMTRERVSALLVVDAGKLVGIVTDRDLRSRCLATGLPDTSPLAAIMTVNPQAMSPEEPAFEALIEMTRRGIHHLPVVRGETVIGLVSSTDLLRVQGVSSVFLADRIHRAADLGELVRQAGELPELWLTLASRGDPPLALGHVVSSIADALVRRLIVLAENRLGPPPVAYGWIVFGSQGRQELTLRSDQDNALILADDYVPARHADYFAQLAGEVSEGLAACGFILCPGQMMASNPLWRKALADWQAEFSDWIEHTDPQKARLATNLFDFRHVHGDASLSAVLRDQITRDSPGRQNFLNHLVANGRSIQVPLGFFRQFVVVRSGEHEGQLDLKRHGILPLVDLARIHALAAGVPEVATPSRLRAAAASPLLTRDGAEALVAAFDFLLLLRVRHQSGQLRQGLTPDNFVDPAQLSAGERQHLRTAFEVIDTQQKALALAYPDTVNT